MTPSITCGTLGQTSPFTDRVRPMSDSRILSIDVSKEVNLFQVMADPEGNEFCFILCSNGIA